MSTRMENMLLADLEARAGASDKDRAAWLAERAAGVTATELRDIMLASNEAAAIQALVRKKRDGDSFTGNAYTVWGSEREPVIGFMLAGYGMVPESRVFHAAHNSRYLASPDGFGTSFDGDLELYEIKTSGKPLPKGSDLLEAKGYEWQMQWCCYVTGAVGSWLVVELRQGSPRSGFEAGSVSREWFPRDEHMIAELVRVADLVLAEMDRQEADGAPVDDPHALALLDADIAATAAQKAARAALEAYCAETGTTSLRAESGSMSYSTPAPRAVFQSAAFKAAHPDLYAEFTEMVAASKPTLRVTPSRVKNETKEAA